MKTHWILATLALALALAACTVPRPVAREPGVPVAPPPVAPAPEFLAPEPIQRDLPNGARLWHFSLDQFPLVSLAIVLPHGSNRDPAGKSGLAALTAEMVDEGAGEHGALEIADLMSFYGATFSIVADHESTTISLHVLERFLEPALDLVADVVLRPRFEEAEWTRNKKLWIDDLRQSLDRNTAVARAVGYRVFFGDAHPYGRPVPGLIADVESLTLDDVRAFYKAYWRPEGATFVSAGSVTVEEITKLLESRLSSWRGAGEAPKPSTPPAAPQTARPRVVVVKKPNAPQTVIRIVASGPAREDPVQVPLALANVAFGGSFTSRLNQNLRETHSFTYGAFSDFTRLRGPGMFVALSSVNAPTTAPALVEFRKEFEGLKDAGVSAEELVKARATLRQGFIEEFETLAGTVGVFTELARVGLDPDEVQQRLDAITTTTLERVNEAARTTVDWSRTTIILVGDPERIAEAIAAEKLEGVVEVDTEGKPI